MDSIVSANIFESAGGDLIAKYLKFIKEKAALTHFEQQLLL
jgi:hypothetical protein